jgi:hypothetical protein
MTQLQELQNNFDVANRAVTAAQENIDVDACDDDLSLAFDHYYECVDLYVVASNELEDYKMGNELMNEQQIELSNIIMDYCEGMQHLEFNKDDLDSMTADIIAAVQTEATTKVSRFEVIDHTETGTGRDFVKYGANVELNYQDDGKTLKVFLKDNEA